MQNSNFKKSLKRGVTSKPGSNGSKQRKTLTITLDSPVKTMRSKAPFSAPVVHIEALPKPEMPKHSHHAGKQFGGSTRVTSLNPVEPKKIGPFSASPLNPRKPNIPFNSNIKMDNKNMVSSSVHATGKIKSTERKNMLGVESDASAKKASSINLKEHILVSCQEIRNKA